MVLRIPTKFKFNKKTAIYLALMTMFFAVIFAHQADMLIDRLLRYAAILIMLAAGIYQYGVYRFEINYKLENKPFFALLILFIGYGFLTSLWSINSSNVFLITIMQLKVFIPMLAIVPFLRKSENTEKIMMVILVALVYTVCLLVVKTPLSSWGHDRVGLEIGLNSNSLGRMVGVGSFLCFHFAYQKKQGWYYILMCMFIMVSLMTGSKNAIFITVFQIGIYWFICSENYKKVFQIVFLVLATVLLIRIVMINQTLYALIGSRLVGMVQTLAGSGANSSDGSTLERMYFIKTGWKLFKMHPYFGVGLNNFSSYLASIHYSNPVYSHCGFVELLSTTGIIGFLLFYSIYVVILIRLVRYVKRRDAVAIFLFVLILRNLAFDFSTISAYTNYIYIFLAIGYYYVTAKKQEERQTLEVS